MLQLWLENISLKPTASAPAQKELGLAISGLGIFLFPAREGETSLYQK